MITRQVVAVWMLSLIEATIYASIPAAVATAIDSRSGASLFVALLLSVTGIIIVGLRGAWDTRVYTRMLRDKIVELIHVDRLNARAKADRWGDAVSALERVGPQVLRGITDATAAIVYLATVSSTACLCLALAAIPFVLCTYWASCQMRTVGEKKNELAATEGELYASGANHELVTYYDEQRRLQVRESDVDATALVIGQGVMYAAKLGIVWYAMHIGETPAVAFAVFMYGERFGNAIDRLSVAAQRVVQLLVAVKV